MLLSRRTLLRGSAALASLGAIPRPAMALLGARPEPAPPIEDPRLRQLTDAAIASALEAGASYADARLTHNFGRRFNTFPLETEIMSIGVRVIVDGFWGYASSPLWSVKEAARLGRGAVRQAKANTLGQVRDMALAPITPVSGGHWETPIQEDPFAISRAEVEDFLEGIKLFIYRQRDLEPMGVDAEFQRTEIAFGSSAGHFTTQRTYRTSGNVTFRMVFNEKMSGLGLDTLTPAGMGFELFRGQPLYEQILAVAEEAREEMLLPVIPVDVGRYDVILGQGAVANLLVGGIGSATQWDRAVGYEANAGGTSYVNDPAEMIGTLKIGNDKVNVVADRTSPAGVATVKWDDEGAPATEFQLVKNGILHDVQTNREGSGFLADAFKARNLPLESRGCAHSTDASTPPLTHTANLKLLPGSGSDTYESMVRDVSHGIQFKTASIEMDFQQITGLLMGNAVEIKNGKRVAVLAGAAITFRTPEIWNAVTALGGANSTRAFGLASAKGQPVQGATSTYTAPPIAVKEVTIIDFTRKA